MKVNENPLKKANFKFNILTYFTGEFLTGSSRTKQSGINRKDRSLHRPELNNNNTQMFEVFTFIRLIVLVQSEHDDYNLGADQNTFESIGFI